MTNDSTVSLTALHANVRRLIWIRGIVFICQLIGLVIAAVLPGINLDYTAIIVILAAFLIYNILFVYYLKGMQEFSDRAFMSHLLVDILVLSALMYFSGGANNPFVSFYLVPVTIAAAVLPWKYTGIIACTSLLAYTLLLFFYQPLVEVMPMNADMTAHDASNFHVLGMWFNFLISAGLITIFVVRMASEIRTQQEKLNEYRENTLRDEQILALATQAAGTAHELGTPLSSVAILVGEMRKENQENKELVSQLSILDGQVTRCKNILQQLVRRGDVKSLSEKEKLSLNKFIHGVLDQWQLLRPEHKITLHFAVEPDIQIQTDQTLQQAILSILNNAADASKEKIEINISTDSTHWYMQIRDYGEGINQKVVDKLGKYQVTTKSSGMGMGLLLSHASINRLGGFVKLFQHEEKGTVTEIGLPLSLSGRLQDE